MRMRKRLNMKENNIIGIRESESGKIVGAVSEPRGEKVGAIPKSRLIEK